MLWRAAAPSRGTGERGGKMSDAPPGPPPVALTEPSSPSRAAVETLCACVCVLEGLKQKKYIVRNCLI